MLCKLFPNHIQTIQLHHRNASSVHWISVERNEIPQRSTHKSIRAKCYAAIWLKWMRKHMAYEHDHFYWDASQTIRGKYFPSRDLVLHAQRTHTQSEWQMPFSPPSIASENSNYAYFFYHSIMCMASTYIRLGLCVIGVSFTLFSILRLSITHLTCLPMPIPILNENTTHEFHITSHRYVIESISIVWCMRISKIAIHFNLRLNEQSRVCYGDK